MAQPTVHDRPADADDFDTEHLATHRLPLDEAAQGYDMFQRRTSR